MQAKWRGQGRMTSSCTLLSRSTVTASAQLWVLRFSWVSTWKKVALLLLELNYDACSLSLSPRRRKGGVDLRTGRRRWTADVSLKARRHQRQCDDNDQPQGQVMLHQQQLEQAASFLLACQWRRPKIVRLRTGWRHARQQPDFLLLFGTRGDSLSGTTTGDGAAEWIKTIVLSSPFSSTSNRRTALKLGTTDLRGLRNTLVQKNRSPPKITLLIGPRLP